MEVSQIAGLDTHAIIGGGKAQAFTMSESAEFFTVLSDTLYRDKKRAVIREVFCNAWDAHIVSGQKDRPVDVTLTDAELVIRDYGPGIPANKIGDIYCRYGASTKVKDENQTGGFGLGSKAPFAYSDHFSVTSCHDGFQYIYAISRGGIETEGKPDFRLMAKVPTTETGVTVSIPLRKAEDRREFQTILESVVKQGGMKAKINSGDPIEGYDYSQADSGFIMVSNEQGLAESAVYCLYGTVLYPVSSTDREILTEVDKIRTLIAHRGRIIILAPPNSVGVTPSRESLSYTDLTKKTLINLMQRVGRIGKAEMVKYTREIMDRAVERIVKKSDRVVWNRIVEATAFNEATRLHSKGVAYTREDICKGLAVVHAFSILHTKRKLWRLTFGKSYKDYRRHFRRLAYKPNVKKHYYESEATINGFRIEARLFQRIANKLSLHENLYAFTGCGTPDHERLKPLRIDKDVHPTTRVIPNRLYISFNQRDAITEIDNYRRTSGNTSYNRIDGHMAFILRRNQHSKIAEIKALAKKYNIEVVEVKLTAPPKKEKREPQVATYFGLSDIKVSSHALPPKGSITTAKYYLRMTERVSINALQPMFKVIPLITEMFGEVALVFDNKEEARFKAKHNAQPLIPSIMEFLIKHEDRKEVQYAFEAVKGFCEDGYYHRPSSIIHSLCSKSFALTQHFFPFKGKMTVIARQAYELLRMIREFDNNSGYHRKFREMNSWKDGQLSSLKKKAKESFGSMRIGWQEADEKFAYLTAAAGIHYHADYDKPEAVATMVDIIRFLERRHKQRAKVQSSKDKKAAETPETELKEAA